jgi:hypothetical protein
MQLAIAVICTGIAASLLGFGAVDVTISQVIILAVYAAGCRIIDFHVERRDP